MKIKEIIVVEGRDDTNRVKEAVECDTFETNGSAITKKKIDRLKILNKKKRDYSTHRPRLCRKKNKKHNRKKYTYSKTRLYI